MNDSQTIRLLKANSNSPGRGRLWVEPKELFPDEIENFRSIFKKPEYGVKDYDYEYLTDWEMAKYFMEYKDIACATSLLKLYCEHEGIKCQVWENKTVYLVELLCPLYSQKILLESLFGKPGKKVTFENPKYRLITIEEALKRYLLCSFPNYDTMTLEKIELWFSKEKFEAITFENQKLYWLKIKDHQFYEDYPTEGFPKITSAQIEFFFLNT